MHIYTHTCTLTDPSIYCAYGPAKHIRHIKLEDAIKRVNSIACERVCVCACVTAFYVYVAHTHTCDNAPRHTEPFVSELAYVHNVYRVASETV